MRAVVLISLLLLIPALIAVPALADRVVLRNGASLSGEIIRETVDEIDLRLADGMRMTIRRSRIKTIVRETEPEAENPGDAPVWTPENRPPQNPAEHPKPETDDPLKTTLPPRVGPYQNSADHAWQHDFSRYPVIMAAKNTSFRAYKFVRRSPLAVDPADDRYADLIRRHSHGGSLAVWEFAYTGMHELRFGDQVRFIGEITSPGEEEAPLIRLKQGPAPTASRLAVFLVKREGRIERYATTTIFTQRDFRQEELRRLGEYSINVRTYGADYLPLASTWLGPAEFRFLAGIDSPLGDSVRTQILRYRFRLDWFDKPPEDRPPLDPDLISRNALRPLAQPGRPVASDELIRRNWGTEERTRSKHNALVEKLRTALSTLNIKPDRSYFVEWDRIGVLGRKGVSIETVRHHLTREKLANLLTPR